MQDPVIDEARPATTSYAATGRYSTLAIWLHWITAILVFTTLPIAWIMTSLPDNDPRGDFYYTLHKSLGVTILVIVVLRLIWRAIKPAPTLPADVPPWMTLAARINHWLLYAILVIMGVTGYLLVAAGGYPLPWFWLFNVPGIPKNETLANIAEGVHVIGRFFVYLFIAVHLLGAIWHVAIRRDGVLDRILPRQRVPRDFT